MSLILVIIYKLSKLVLPELAYNNTVPNKIKQELNPPNKKYIKPPVVDNSKCLYIEIDRSDRDVHIFRNLSGRMTSLHAICFEKIFNRSLPLILELPSVIDPYDVTFGIFTRGFGHERIRKCPKSNQKISFSRRP